MEHDIDEPGEHLAALQKIIAVDVRIVLKQLPPPTALPPADRAALLHFVCPIIDEYAARVRYELFKECRAHAHAQVRYLASRQHALLELIDHLLQHTQSIQLYSTLSHRTVADDICRHTYRVLERLLDYTVTLAGGQIDPGLPMPPGACALYQQMLGSDLAALRDRLMALQVSPGLIDIALKPFESLRHADDLTFYTAVYLRAFKEKLQQLAFGNQPTSGDGDVIRTLIALNLNDPACISYCVRIMADQLQTSTSPEARLGQLHDYKLRLAGLPSSTDLAWHPYKPSVQQQLAKWLAEVSVVPAPTIHTPRAEIPHELASDEAYDDMAAKDGLMFHIRPVIAGAIANAAHVQGIIHLGDTDVLRSERLSRIPSSVNRVAPETIRRGFTDAAVCRKALLYWEQIGNHLREIVKKNDEKSTF
ncbi:hypothetical protein [Dawidia soli]|uniref:Uncharacterized protein n=1 Tax=Dawidia soli TaxID=2782352 RepID=A0AAP2DBX7_9BACT|nr:hypothetical protein [Dawidia soli]MBT1688286.1 hypothetical protein [Dawidia soli]